MAGCGGKLARTGCAVVTDVTCNGEMRVHYADGKIRWKRIDSENFDRDVRTAEQNRFKPGKYVETKSGGTLTFPGEKTIVYYDTF
jgi:hypothetical protein